MIIIIIKGNYENKMPEGEEKPSLNIHKSIKLNSC